MFINALLELMLMSLYHNPEPEPVVDEPELDTDAEPAPSLWRDQPDADPDPDPDPDPAVGPNLEPEPEPEPVDDETQALAARDAELVERERAMSANEQRFQAMLGVQKLLEQGKHREAYAAMGGDPNTMLREHFGEELIPQQQQTAEEMIAENKRILDEQKRQLQHTQEEVARMDLRREAQGELNEEEYPIQSMFARRGKQAYFNGVIDDGIAKMKTNGIFPDWKTLFKSREDSAHEKCCADAAELLKIDSVRKTLGVEFAKDQGSKPRPTAASPAVRVPQSADEPPAPSLSNAMNQTPPIMSKPPGKMNKQQRRDESIRILREARLKREALEAKNK